MFRAPWTAADLERLGEEWRAAEPFPHVIVDGFAPTDESALFEVLEDEPVQRYVGDLYAFDATAPTATTAAFSALVTSFAAALCPGVSALAGKPVTRVDLRAYAYRPGDHLLPHTDHRDGLERRIAYAYYLPTPDAPTGGELELYRCAVDAADELADIASARVITTQPFRLALFDVCPTSLHQVREVLGGLRLSLAGWFYR